VFKTFWDQLGTSSRWGLIAGVVSIIGAAIAAASWLTRADYQVLFTDMKPQDTAVMVAELERMKLPYRIGGDGNTILMEGSQVPATRLKLMGKDLPLQGSAGFEIFNNADFGMTEFAQKINYQRALQGEITRTILSLAEVRDVRVHLALPEEGLFKRATSKAKAAITLKLKAGQSLRAEQITGIQRLVAAAVPGMAVQEVTIVDEQGVALTRRPTAEHEQESGSARLDLKRDTEQMLARKVNDVFDLALGEGQAMVSVDVTLNMDAVRVTTEEVVGAPEGNGRTGVVVRERIAARDAAPLKADNEAAGLKPTNTQREIEYQVGRRTEQVATQPGAIRRLNVVAIMRQPLDDIQLGQMKLLVAAAVGAVPERGDTVVVQSLRSFDSPVEEVSGVQDLPGSTAHSAAGRRSVAAPSEVRPEHGELFVALGALLLLAVSASLVVLYRRPKPVRPEQLTAAQRKVLLGQLEEWLEAPDPKKGRA
jgi:flagellar M-ring protein FliF